MSVEGALPAGRENERAIRYVLFVCNHNAGRSQMAQAFFERYAPEDFRAESAGSDPAPAVWPVVLEAMSEIGFDLTGAKPKKLTVEMQLHADWAITMGCDDACPYVASAVEAWDTPDPARRSLEEVRAIRDGIQARVRELLATRLDEIRTDRTAHRLRLEALLPTLVDEFADIRSPEEIRACADAVLDQFHGVPVRSHILTLAHRHARECLRQPTCELLTGTSM